MKRRLWRRHVFVHEGLLHAARTLAACFGGGAPTLCMHRSAPGTPHVPACPAQPSAGSPLPQRACAAARLRTTCCYPSAAPPDPAAPPLSPCCSRPGRRRAPGLPAAQHHQERRPHARLLRPRRRAQCVAGPALAGSRSAARCSTGRGASSCRLRAARPDPDLRAADSPATATPRAPCDPRSRGGQGVAEV